MLTVCIRCGKQRVVVKNWKETIGTTVTTYELTVCPDAECQKIVDRELQKKKEKMIAFQHNSQERRKSLTLNRKTKGK